MGIKGKGKKLNSSFPKRGYFPEKQHVIVTQGKYGGIFFKTETNYIRTKLMKKKSNG